LKHGRDQWRAILIPLDIGNVPHAEFTRSLGESRLFAKQENLDLWKQSPGPDRVALDRRNVRIGESFGGGEESEQGHKFNNKFVAARAKPEAISWHL
jgi:hypothetical protein